MKADQIIDMALRRAGMHPALCQETPGENCLGMTLRERMRNELERTASKAILETRKEELTGWKALPPQEARDEGDGRCLLTLPPDFLRLHSLRLEGWERSISEILPTGTHLHKMQSCRHKGLRGTPQRPLAFAATDHNGGATLELFSCGKREKATIKEGWYMPAPRIDSQGDIEIPPAAVERCVDLLVQSVET